MLPEDQQVRVAEGAHRRAWEQLVDDLGLLQADDVGCRQMTSGATSVTKRARWSSRWRSELTFQVAMRRDMSGECR